MTPHDAFLHQSRACAALGSPFMGRLMALLAPRIASGGPIYDRIGAWPGDLSPAGESVPLRLAGALHRLVLTGADPALAAVYPPAEASDADLLAAVGGALIRHSGQIDRWLDTPPQTNEVRRSAVLIAGAHHALDHFALPLRLSELGASAGLNLVFDRFAMTTGGAVYGDPASAVMLTPDWDGPAPTAQPLSVASRGGVDLAPVDLSNPDHRLRLRSYVWPDQPDRMRLTEAAIAVAQSQAVSVDQGDAADWLSRALAQPRPGTLHLIYHTIAWQYFSAETANRAEQAIRAAGAKATSDTPLAWLGLEADGRSPGAAITLRLWPGDLALSLGRADYHGRWVRWDPTPI